MLEETIRFVGFMFIVAIGGADVTLNYKNKWIPNIPYMIWGRVRKCYERSLRHSSVTFLRCSS